MIIDLTSSKLEAAPVVHDPDDYWDAWYDWKEFREARTHVDADSVPDRSVRVRVVKAALLNEHMRVVLKRCSCRAIRPEVVKIINDLEPVNPNVPGNPPMWMNQLATEEASARIVDLDSRERSRREADHD